MPSPFEFTLQFSPGVRNVNAATGVLTGVTVAEVGPATGHFAFLDKAGNVVGVGGRDDGPEIKGAVRRLQLAMDEKSLETVVAAGKKAQRFKTREDHDDSIAARAGQSTNFRLEDGKVVCDVSIFDAYANRAVFLETAEKTPELIGLSGDFKFVAEIVGDQAMMRVTRIDAVDIVDQGALTHAGLFKVRAQVDTPPTENLSIMAKSTPEKPDLKAFKELCAAVAAYRAANAESVAEIDECMAGLMPTPVPGDTVEAKAAASAKADIVKELTATFSAKLEEVKATIKTEVEAATRAQAVEFQKRMSALGIKFEAAKEPTAEEIAAAKKLADEAEAKLKAEKQDFLALKAARAKEKNIAPSEAARQIMAEFPDAYSAHLRAKGIIKAA